MALSFQAASAAVSGNGTSGTITWPGSPNGQMLIAIFAFDGVGAGSSPYIDHTFNAGGWFRAFSQAPSGSGCGIEVWNTYGWTSATNTQFIFTGTYNFVGRGLVYTGQYNNGADSPVRATASQATTGDSPSTPTITAFAGEMLLAVAADTLSAPGFGTPSPALTTSRFDSTRSGLGTGEVTAADFQVKASGINGPFVWPAITNPGGALGAAGVLAIRAATAPASTGPIVDAPMPENLLLGQGYSLRVTALDPTTGAIVSGVNVGTVVLTAGSDSVVTDGGGGAGDWMLVPGINA